MNVPDVPRDGAIGAFSTYLDARGLQLTEARAAIVEAALTRTGHYAIEELIAELRERGIRGSRATVYRMLPLLVEAGIVRPALIGGNERTYETIWGRPPHAHLRCSRCGCVVEFELGGLEEVQREIAARHGFRLERDHHELVGMCDTCSGVRAADTV